MHTNTTATTKTMDIKKKFSGLFGGSVELS